MKEFHIKDICSKGSSALKQKDLHETGKYPVYGASGIAGYLDTYHQDEEYIAIVKDGSGIGRVTFNEGKTSIIGTMQYILPKKGYNIRYIGYCLQSLDLANYRQGAAIPHIYFRDYGERIVKVTDNPVEQQRIVEQLDAAFAQIDKLKNNAERQLAEARSLFQSALTQAMQPKPGWQEKKLKDIVDAKCPISYGIVQQGEHIPGGIPVVRPIDLTKKYVVKDGLKCTEEIISNRYKRTILQGNEILLSVRGTTGVLSLATSELKGCNVNRGIVPLFFKDYISRDFIYYFMESPQMQKVFAEKTTGSTLKQINIKDLRNIDVLFPPFLEQQVIVSHLDAFTALVRDLERVNRETTAECDALKQALLRQIFE